VTLAAKAFADAGYANSKRVAGSTIAVGVVREPQKNPVGFIVLPRCRRVGCGAPERDEPAAPVHLATRCMVDACGLQLDFGQSRGLAEGVSQGARQDEAPFRSVALAAGHHRSLFTPERVAHRRECVDEGRLWFGVSCGRGGPGALADRLTSGE
jgi:hypothetical protein